MNPYFLCVAVVVLPVFVWIVAAMRQQRSFAECFSPISDAEFLARCTPGTHPEVALRVRKIIADSLGVEYERIHPSTRFVEDLGAD